MNQKHKCASYRRYLSNGDMTVSLSSASRSVLLTETVPGGLDVVYAFEVLVIKREEGGE